MSASDRRALIDRGASLSIRRQCVLLGVARRRLPDAAPGQRQ